MTSAGRDSTLADYVHVIARSKRMIALVAVACGAIALLVSLAQTSTYQAEASESVRDPSQDLSLTGTSYLSAQTPLQLQDVGRYLGAGSKPRSRVVGGFPNPAGPAPDR